MVCTNQRKKRFVKKHIFFVEKTFITYYTILKINKNQFWTVFQRSITNLKES